MRLMSDIAADLHCIAAVEMDTEGPQSKPTDQLAANTMQGLEQGVGKFPQKDTTNLA